MLRQAKPVTKDYTGIIGDSSSLLHTEPFTSSILRLHCFQFLARSQRLHYYGRKRPVAVTTGRSASPKIIDEASARIVSNSITSIFAVQIHDCLSHRHVSRMLGRLP